MDDAEMQLTFPMPTNRTTIANKPMPSTDRNMTTRPVWDLFIRSFHWLLVTAITIGAVTGFILGPTWLRMHLIAGTIAVALVVARIIWGFSGGSFARFAGFVASPRETLRHLAELRRASAPRHVGHNPAGGWMILFLLGMILLLAITGTTVLGGVFKTGPLGFAVSYDLGSAVNKIHKLLAWGLLGLIALHVAGAIYESLRTRENLPLTMITGRKQARPGDHLPPSRAAHPRTAALIMLAGGALGTVIVLTLAQKPVPHLPITPLDPTYAQECGDCHIPFHPSLMSAQRWRMLMASLDSHFGEDASLDEETRKKLEDWRVAHAAETVDTKPAHVFAQADPENPISLTATPFWKNTHKAIPDKVFKSKPIYARTNCAACHKDAEIGMFYPSNIEIPAEAKQ